MRRKAFDIEDQLKDYFHQVTLIPVPDDAPEEIPRISTTSHNGHSQLNISLSNTQLFTNYDEAFEGKWENCLEYVENRVNTLYSILGKYTNEGISNMDTNFNRYKEAREVFPVVRDFSEDELLQYNKSLDNLFEPTGVNIFDL